MAFALSVVSVPGSLPATMPVSSPSVPQHGGPSLRERNDELVVSTSGLEEEVHLDGVAAGVSVLLVQEQERICSALFNLLVDHQAVWEKHSACQDRLLSTILEVHQETLRGLQGLQSLGADFASVGGRGGQVVAADSMRQPLKTKVSSPSKASESSMESHKSGSGLTKQSPSEAEKRRTLDSFEIVPDPPALVRPGFVSQKSIGSERSSKVAASQSFGEVAATSGSQKSFGEATRPAWCKQKSLPAAKVSISEGAGEPQNGRPSESESRSSRQQKCSISFSDGPSWRGAGEAGPGMVSTSSLTGHLDLPGLTESPAGTDRFRKGSSSSSFKVWAGSDNCSDRSDDEFSGPQVTEADLVAELEDLNLHELNVNSWRRCSGLHTVEDWAKDYTTHPSGWPALLMIHGVPETTKRLRSKVENYAIYSALFMAVSIEMVINPPRELLATGENIRPWTSEWARVHCFRRLFFYGFSIGIALHMLSILIGMAFNDALNEAARDSDVFRMFSRGRAFLSTLKCQRAFRIGCYADFVGMSAAISSFVDLPELLIAGLAIVIVTITIFRHTSNLLFYNASIMSYWSAEHGGNPDPDDPYDLTIPVGYFDARSQANRNLCQRMGNNIARRSFANRKTKVGNEPGRKVGNVMGRINLAKSKSWSSAFG